MSDDHSPFNGKEDVCVLANRRFESFSDSISELNITADKLYEGVSAIRTVVGDGTSLRAISDTLKEVRDEIKLEREHFMVFLQDKKNVPLSVFLTVTVSMCVVLLLVMIGDHRVSLTSTGLIIDHAQAAQ